MAVAGNKKLILSGCLVVDDKREHILLLLRKDHGYYETPGGKLQGDETLEQAALRELHEELGDGVKVESVKYFGNVEFVIPDGRRAEANKFLVNISGAPRVNEPKTFERLDWLPIKNLEDYPLSPDLKLLLQEIKEKILG